MNYKKLIVALFTLAVVSPASASAVSAPDFPSCSNPQGALKVSYDGGQHAIVGSGLVEGSDKVYSIDGYNRLLQCLCKDNGQGVETLWWRISSLTQSQIEELAKLGWIYVPNGADWGLDEAPYMAKNGHYLCSYSPPGPPECKADRPDAPTILSVERSGSSATITWTKVEKATHYTISYGEVGGDYIYGVPNTGNQTSYTINDLNPYTNYAYKVYAVNDCMPSEASTYLRQVGGQVLGLATTGTAALIATTLASGVALTLSGLSLKKKRG